MSDWLQAIDGVLSGPDFVMTLLSLVIKSSLVLAAALLTAALCRERPVIRSFVLAHGLSLSLLLPLFMVIAPDWRLPLLGWINVTSGTAVGATAIAMPLAVEAAAENAPSFSLVGAAVAIWLIVALALLGRHALGWFLMRGIVRRATQVDDSETHKTIERIAAGIHLRRPVQVAYSSEIASPVTAGLRRHTILLPECARRWSRPLVEMSLTHELAHIRRRDICRYTLGSIAVAAYWLNPLVWICRRKLVAESEKACDDFVIMNGTDAHAYAETLLGIARQVSRVRLVVPVGVRMTRKSELEGRLMSIMNNHKRSFGMRLPVVAGSVLLAFLLVLPLAGVQLAAADDTAPAASVEKQKQAKAEETARLNAELKKNQQLAEELQAKKAAAEKQGEELKKKEQYLAQQSEAKKDEAKKQGEAKKQNDAQYPKPDDFVPMTNPPEMIEMVRPEYPEAAVKAKMEGATWVKALVDTEGVVKDALVYKSCGYDKLDKSAVTAAYKCKYKPGANNGKKVAAWVVYKVEFTHDGDKQ